MHPVAVPRAALLVSSPAAFREDQEISAEVLATVNPALCTPPPAQVAGTKPLYPSSPEMTAPFIVRIVTSPARTATNIPVDRAGSADVPDCGKSRRLI